MTSGKEKAPDYALSEPRALKRPLIESAKLVLGVLSTLELLLLVKDESFLRASSARERRRADSLSFWACSISDTVGSYVFA